MRLVDLFSKSRFRLHVAWLAGGAAVSQAITALAALLLARLYTPTAFGELALLLSVAGIASSFSGLRYELGIVPAENDEVAATVMAVQCACNVLVAALVFAVIVIFDQKIASLIGVPQLAAWLYLTPLLVLFTGAGSALTCWLIRKQRFQQLAIYRAVQSLSCAATQGAAGFGGARAGGLIAGTIVGQIAFASAAICEIRRGYFAPLWRQLSFGKLFASAHRHLNFPKYVIAFSLAGTLRDRGLLIALGALSSTHEAGLYSFALRLVYMPIGLISSSFSSVIYQRVADPAMRPDADKLIYSVMTKLVNFAAPAFVTLAWFSPALFEGLFGRAWTKAGLYAAIWVPPAFMSFMSYLFERMFDIVGRQKIAMNIELGYTIVALPAFALVLSYSHNATAAIALLSALCVIYHIVWIVSVYLVFRFPISDLIRVSLRTLALASVTGAALWLGTRMVPAMATWSLPSSL